MAKQSKKRLKAKDFDEIVESGKDLSGVVDFSKAKTVKPGRQTVNVDFPVWVVEALDQESERQGLSRQALIKAWIVEKVDSKKTA